MKLTILTAVFVSAITCSPGNLRASVIETVRPFVQRVEASVASLPPDRRKALSVLAQYVADRLNRGESAKLLFVCTHNSRRSHLSQIWCQIAATHYDVSNVETYSGGTEATACNIRTIRVLRRTGLSAVVAAAGKNPIYLIQYAESKTPMRIFSKVYDDSVNPNSDFAAIMCCADADQRCPLVKGADGRFPLHYEDPRDADNTPDEVKRYDESNFQIAQEMFFVMSEVSRLVRK